MRDQMGLDRPLKSFAILTDKFAQSLFVTGVWAKEVLYRRALQLYPNRNSVDGHNQLQRVLRATKNGGVAKQELHRLTMPRLNWNLGFDPMAARPFVFCATLVPVRT